MFLGTMCCTIYTAWGAVTLAVLALFAHTVNVNMGEFTDIPKTKLHMFIGAALYLVIAILLAARWIFLEKMKKTNPGHPGLS